MYGNVSNRMFEHSEWQQPIVDDCVTSYHWSDRHSYKIVEVITPKKIAVVEDEVTFNMEGHSTRIVDGKGEPIILRYSKSRKGWCMLHDPKGTLFRIGIRNPYHDPGF